MALQSNQKMNEIVGSSPSIKQSAKPAGKAKHSDISESISSHQAVQWRRVRQQLKTKLGLENFVSWFASCRLESVSNSEVRLSVPTFFLRNWIRSNYEAIVLELWQHEIKTLLRIEISVRNKFNNSSVRGSLAEDSEMNIESPSVTRRKKHQMDYMDGSLEAELENMPSATGGVFGSLSEKSAASKKLTGLLFDINYKFATLVEGQSNQMAVASAREISQADGEVPQYNPLFIHSDVGLGKTHLLHSIAWAAKARMDELNIVYLTAEHFMRQLISAIKGRTILNFKESWSNIDLLLVDDLQFLQGRVMQQEFCNLLNFFIDHGKQVVIVADQPPAMLQTLNERLRSRLQGGVTLEITSPCEQMRRQILEMRYSLAQKNPQYHGLDIESNVLDYIAKKIKESGRDIEAAFNQILIKYKLSGEKIKLSNVETLIAHLLKASKDRRINIDVVQKVVGKHYKVTKADMLSKRQSRAIVFPRQVAMYLSKVLTTRSMPDIGKKFGGRDHSTVIYAVKQIEKALKTDKKLKSSLALLKQLIVGQ